MNITVVTRFVKSDGWKDGFPVHCLKYEDGTYSSDYGLEKTFKEEHVYTGPIPPQLRILNKVDPKYLLGYMTFYSQVIPKGIDPRVVKALRGQCPIRGYNVFDAQAYNPQVD